MSATNIKISSKADWYNHRCRDAVVNFGDVDNDTVLRIVRLCNTIEGLTIDQAVSIINATAKINSAHYLNHIAQHLDGIGSTLYESNATSEALNRISSSLSEIAQAIGEV